VVSFPPIYDPREGGTMKQLMMVLMALAMASVAGADDLEVTVYNNGVGLVKEIRGLQIKRGVHELAYPGVPERLQPETVHFLSMRDPDGTRVLEQNYRYDLLNRESLLERYRGQEVKAWVDGDWQTVRLLAHGTPPSESTPIGRILEVDGGIHIEGFILPALPEGLLLEPSLVWLIDSDKGGYHDVELSYITEGLAWQADFVAVIDKANMLDLTAWVTLDNRSGRAYENARLKLVAGDVRRVSSGGHIRGGRAKEYLMMADAAPSNGFAEEEFFEYHLYTLGRPTTILDREKKQLELFAETGTEATRRYLFESWYQHEDREPRALDVSLEFENSKEKGPGVPLPKGIVRVYMEDDSGQLQFAGEDAIPHTPEDETVRLKVGETFDLRGEHHVLRVDRKHKGRVHEMDIEVTLRNHKDEEALFTAVENIYRGSEWKILAHSHDYERLSNGKLQFEVNVPAKGETKITYTIRVE